MAYHIKTFSISASLYLHMHTVGCETNKKNWLLFSFFFFGFHFRLFFPKGLVTAFGGARLFAICLFTFQDLFFLFFRHFSLFFMLLPIAAFPDPSVFSHRKSIYICEKHQKLIQNQNQTQPISFFFEN